MIRRPGGNRKGDNEAHQHSQRDIEGHWSHIRSHHPGYKKITISRIDTRVGGSALSGGNLRYQYFQVHAKEIFINLLKESDVVTLTLLKRDRDNQDN